MPRTIKQHTVPQMILRRFANAKGKLFVFDKVAKRSFPANVLDVAQENTFYDLSLSLFPPEIASSIDSQMIEKALSRLESDFAVTLETFMSNAEKRGVRQKHRANLASFILLQLSRTSEFRCFLHEIHTKWFEVMGQRLLDQKEGKGRYRVRVNYDEDKLPLEQAMMMFDPDQRRKNIQILCQHLWLVAVNHTDVPFWISDNPVARRAHVEHPFLGGIGLASLGVEIAFPLSPSILLMLYDRRYFHQHQALDGRPNSVPAEVVTYYNSLQVTNSQRFIYSPINDFGLAEKVCREHPHVCDPTRERIGTG